MKIKELQKILENGYEAVHDSLYDAGGKKIEAELEHVVYEVSNSIEIYEVVVCEDGYLPIFGNNFEINFLEQKVPHDIYSRYDKMENFFIKDIGEFGDNMEDSKPFKFDEVEILENWIKKHNEKVYENKKNEILKELEEEIEEIRNDKKWELFDLENDFSEVK